MSLAKAKVKLKGRRDEYLSMVLVDTGARMGVIDKSVAEQIGAELAGREIDFLSISGHVWRHPELP